MTQTEQRPPRVVQMTDCHLFASVEGKLWGLNTEDSLRLVLDRVALEQSRIDVILATGDLSQDGTRFVIKRPLKASSDAPVQVVLNWQSLLTSPSRR